MRYYSQLNGLRRGLGLPQILLLIVCLLSISSLGIMSYLKFGIWGVLYFALAVCAVIVVFLIIYLVFKWIASRKAAKFEKELTEAQDPESDSFVLDPAEQGRVDELKDKFDKGLKTLKDSGKNLSKLPLYLMVGEPGAGKTEAIRHSSIRFPQGLNDLLQGTGGTYSMDWWFTSDAVILDTAGAILLEDASNSRFDAFLKQLKSHRADYPITGLTLAVPADSLLLDDEREVEEKAQKLFDQFSHIQKTLDLRFPVYLLITKADLITGFREFFDASGQEGYQQQMLGWSNNESLDAPFNPTIVERAFAPIIDRLRTIRAKLLTTSSPAATSRTEQFDALYAFPEKFAEVIPRIQKYLQVLFERDDWHNRRPPLFRGIYFTSSMRQGAAIDQELASALNVPVSQLPVTGMYQTEKSLFLRDFFIEKLFREKGLVTRMTNIAAGLRNRMLRFYLTTAGVAVALLLVGWYASSKLNKRMLEDKKRWNLATQYWNNGTFFPLIDDAQTNAKYVGRETVPESSDTRLEFYGQVSEKVGGMLGWGWYFSPLPAYQKLKDDRERARIVLIEGSLVKPLLESARQKLTTSGRGVASKKEIAATLALTRLECLLEEGRPLDDLDTVTEIFQPLLQLTIPEVFPVDGKSGPTAQDGEALISLIHQAYSELDDRYNGRLRWMSEGAPYRAIRKGTKLFANHKDVIDRKDNSNADANKLREKLLREYKFFEDELWDHVVAADDFRKVENNIDALTKAAERLSRIAAPTGTSITRKEYYRVDSTLRELMSQMPQSLQGKITRSLDSFGLPDSDWVALGDRNETLDPSDPVTVLIKAYLTPADDGIPLYQKRVDAYRANYPLLDTNHSLWKAISTMKPGELGDKIAILEERVKERVARLDPYPAAPNAIPEESDEPPASGDPEKEKRAWLAVQTELKELSKNGQEICNYLDRGTEEMLKAKLLDTHFTATLRAQEALIFRQPFGTRSPALDPARDLEKAGRVINAINNDFRTCDSFRATSRHYKLQTAVLPFKESNDGSFKTIRDKFLRLLTFKNAVVDENNAVRNIPVALGPFFVPNIIQETTKRKFKFFGPKKTTTIEIKKGIKAVRVGKNLAQAEQKEPNEAQQPFAAPFSLADPIQIQYEFHPEDNVSPGTMGRGGNWGTLNWIFQRTDRSFKGGATRSDVIISHSGKSLTLQFVFPSVLPQKSRRISGF